MPTIDQPEFGTEVFESLRAEEEPWLAQAFLRPPQFNSLAGPRSYVIYGESGAGKSAVIRMLEARAVEIHPARILVPVHWQPLPSESAPQTLWRDDIFAQCTRALMAFLTTREDLLQSGPPWAVSLIASFLRAYPHPLAQFEIQRLVEGASPTVKTWLESLQDIDLHTTASLRQLAAPEIIKPLLNALQTLGIEGLWIMADGFERWLDLENDDLADEIKHFLSTLALFEQPGFVFKIAMPMRWQQTVHEASGITRRRMDEYELKWSEEQLVDIVNQRLTFALNRQDRTLLNICTDDGITAWLHRYAGMTPRGWLSWIRYIYDAYLEGGAKKPIDAAQWKSVRRRFAPRIRITPDKRVWIGPHEITGLSQSLYRVLEYLYVESNRICTKEEIYYRAYKGYESIPRSGEHLWEDTWQASMDTVLWRLRQSVEPDPHDPLFIQTERGRGIRLDRTS